jgi:hypothetical protein
MTWLLGCLPFVAAEPDEEWWLNPPHTPAHDSQGVLFLPGVFFD